MLLGVLAGPPLWAQDEGGQSDQDVIEAAPEFDPEHPPGWSKSGLEGWSVADTFYFKSHGAVENVDGELRLGAGKPGTGVAWTRGVARINYELQFQAKRTAGQDFFCGLTFPIHEAYCTLILGGWGGGLTGLSNIDDFAADSNQTTGYIEFENDRWYTVRLRVTDEQIEAWVDGESILKVPTANRKFSIWWEQEPMRPLGLATWRTGAAFKGWSYRVLDAAAKSESDNDQ